MLKRTLSALCAVVALSVGVCCAQADTLNLPVPAGQTAADEPQPVKKRQPLEVNFDVRADWQLNTPSVDGGKAESAFTGRFLNVIINGNITDQFSYHFRHRINKQNLTQDFFEATDFAYLKYKVNNQWEFTAGKGVVGIGGFEYDAAPIDVYYYSIGGSNLPTCYEFGVSSRYTTKKGNNNFFLQITNSPFTSKSYRFEGLYSYNLMWYGDFKVFKTIYSVNMIEYRQNQYINYIALGNQFNFGPVSWYIDYLNRYALKGNFFTDFSVMSRLTYNILDRADIFVKGGIDYNMSQSASTPEADIWDTVVLPGTCRGFYGAGVEFYPMKNSRDLRLHAFWYSNSDNVKQHSVGVGLRWLLRAYKH